MLSNIPNLLTLLRILLIPVFVVCFFLPMEWGRSMAAGVFMVAALTDWLDGYLARKWNQLSAFGAFLDPVADKLMVAAALLLLVQADPSPWLVLPALVIVSREITISALREWMAELGERASVAVSTMGKVKTTAQMGAITLMIYQQELYNLPTYLIGYVLLYVAAVLTFWSMVIYIKAAWPSLINDSSQQ